MINLFRGNETLKGITLGLLSLIILESGTLYTLAALYTIRKFDYIEDAIYYFAILTFNAIIAGLLGISITKKFRIIKKIAYILNIIVFIMIIAGFTYYAWYRLTY